MSDLACSGCAAGVNDGLRPFVMSASNVNWDTTSTDPPVSTTDRFILPSASEKIRVFDKGVDVQPHYDTFGEFQLLYRSGDVFMPHLDNAEPLKTEMSHFLDAIEGRDTLLSSGRDGLQVVQILEQACESIKADGRPMDLVYDI